MGWFSRTVSKVKSGYKSLDKKLGGYLPGGVSPGKTTTTAKTTTTTKPTTTVTPSGVRGGVIKPAPTGLQALQSDVKATLYKLAHPDAFPTARQDVAMAALPALIPGAAAATKVVQAGAKAIPRVASAAAPVVASLAQKAGGLVSRGGQAITRAAPVVQRVTQPPGFPPGFRGTPAETIVPLARNLAQRLAASPITGPVVRPVASIVAQPAVQTGLAMGGVAAYKALAPTKPPGVATTTPPPAAPGGAQPGGVTAPPPPGTTGMGTPGGWRPATPGGAPGTGTTSMTTTTTMPGTPTQPEGMQPGQTTQSPAQPGQPGQPGQPEQPAEVQQPDFNQMYQDIVTAIDQAAKENLAMTKAWLDNMTATLDSLQAQVMDMFKQQGTVLDPATLAALKAIRDEVDRRRQLLQEEMNRRGLLQSGIWLEEENRILSNQLTAEERLLASRLADIQNRMTDALMSFANQRVNIMGQAMQQGMETARWAGGLKIGALGDIQQRRTEWQKWWQSRLDEQRKEAEAKRQWEYEQGLERAKTIAGWTGKIPEGYPGAGEKTWEVRKAEMEAAQKKTSTTNTAATNKYIAQIPTYSSFEEAMADFNRYKAIMEGEGADTQQILNTIYAYFGRAR